MSVKKIIITCNPLFSNILLRWFSLFILPIFWQTLFYSLSLWFYISPINELQTTTKRHINFTCVTLPPLRPSTSWVELSFVQLKFSSFDKKTEFQVIRFELSYFSSGFESIESIRLYISFIILNLKIYFILCNIRYLQNQFFLMILQEYHFPTRLIFCLYM